MSAVNDGTLIPSDLLVGDVTAEVVDKYEVAAAASAGSSSEAYNYPIVHVTSSAPRDHGGALGFDATKPFSTIVRSPRGRFVMPDLSSVPKAQMKAVSDEARRRFDLVGGKNDRNYSSILAQVFEENFSCTLPNGEKLDHINTWVNNNKDPFGREVRLPPPAIVSKTRKAAAVTNGFVSHTSQMAGNPHMGPPTNPAMGMAPNFFPHFDPSRGQQQGPPQFGPPQASHSTHVGPQQQQRQAGPVPIPPPDKTVMFHLGAGTLTSAYHFVQSVNEDVYHNGMNQVVTYVILTRNMAAVGGGDNFVPQTPAPGTVLHITMPTGEVYQVWSVILKFQIGKVHNTILLVSPPVSPEAQPVPDLPVSEVQDEMGQSAPISAEDAASMM